MSGLRTPVQLHVCGLCTPVQWSCSAFVINPASGIILASRVQLPTYAATWHCPPLTALCQKWSAAVSNQSISPARQACSSRFAALGP